jgi:2'-5' RNA ligase
VPESAVDIVVEYPPIADLPYWQRMAEIGVPPHVTLLYPWRAPRIDAPSIAALRVVAEQFAPFTMSLNGVETFAKGVVYATLEPDSVLRSMIRALADAFPDTPPFGGEFAPMGPTPHCTLAKGDADELDRLRAELTERLDPFLPATIDVSSICVEEESASGTWSLTSTIQLGPAGDAR